ncbi:MAG: DUF3320 domain-containing protein [bacterium]
MTSPTLSGSSEPNIAGAVSGADGSQPRVEPDAQLAAKIHASAENWRRKLLDLTKRNRLLNFRSTKVSTVTIVDEQPAEVFRRLYLLQGAMRFKAAPETAIAPPETSDFGGISGGQPVVDILSDTILDDEDTKDDLHPEFVPYDVGALDERHTDEWLQTTADPDSLDTSLRRIEEQARTTIEEQGVNTLFLAVGMLHYRESPDSSEWFRAPLVLVPADLVRKTARSGFTLRAGDDDPVVNPALAEFLRLSFGVVLPALPDSSAMLDDYDLQHFLTSVQTAIAGQAGWTVKTDLYLALFNFQKFVMYKDLEANAAALEQHRLIRQLVGRTGSYFGTVPDEIRHMALDEEYPPEATYQVVDADSSQLRAIAAVAHNYDLVLEGPPGTGKSQTITNLIAQALSVGKSVLFVAEKMAALEVVHSRLVAAGLGEFCLELHSSKANKRTVMRALAAALDASLQRPTTLTVSTERIPIVRATLGDYVSAVHAPYGVLGISPYRGYGELGIVRDAPRLPWVDPIEHVTREQLAQTVRDLRDLARVASTVGAPSAHPFAGASKTFYSEADLETVTATAANVERLLGDVIARSAKVSEALSLPGLQTFADVETAAVVADVLARSPGAPLAVLQSDAWNAPPPAAIQLIEQGRELDRRLKEVRKLFGPEVLERQHSEDIAYVRQKAGGVFGFLAMLDGRFRSIKKRWRGYRAQGYEPSVTEQAAEMQQVDQTLATRRSVRAADAAARELFGELWQGDRSNWDALERYVAWVVEFRGSCVKHGLSGNAIETATRVQPDLSPVVALRDAANAARLRVAALEHAVGLSDGLLMRSPLHLIRARTSALLGGIGLAPRWAAFEAVRQTVAAGIAGALLRSAMEGEVAFEQLPEVFLRAFYQRWLDLVVQERPSLRSFDTLTHEERVAEFQMLDERVLLENRAALVSLLRDAVQHRLQEPAAVATMPVLRREMVKQRNLMPLRKTMLQAEPAIRAIKPCMMMSPLTVAQLLPGRTPTFDLVVFDEASQLTAEDAVGAVIRGRQLVVVGDPKQLPPTNFFSVMSGQQSAPLGDDGQPLYEDAESILEEYMGSGVPMSRLKWHYRSAHESLITFSNVSFYNADLYTFPSVETGSDTAGLQFEYVADGIYEGKGLNALEARRVADAVIRFAKEQSERQANGQAVDSLGVGTFNLRQQLAIQDELELRRRADPSIELFFARGGIEPFFVKNLENIQGDERDVIFISVTYAKAADGRLRYNFGPLNGQNGARRLNVLITRARKLMRVYSSMKGDEISAAATTTPGPRLLREFLTYAETGRVESSVATAIAGADSPFEQEVLRELLSRNISAVAQIGAAGYRIDIGVMDPAAPGRFLCGIECDGVAYHNSETARDRDRLRQQVLEARGWTIHRVWSTDWFKDRSGQIERLLTLLAADQRRAIEEAEENRSAQARAAEQAHEEKMQSERAAAEAATLAAAGPILSRYVRPVAEPYMMTPGEGRYQGSDFLAAPTSEILQAVLAVVQAESPIHRTDLFTRVAGIWGTRAGSRIATRIDQACSHGERDGLLGRRGDFLWGAAGRCAVRSRIGTRIPADRIAPEEYQAAVLLVLKNGLGFTREQLTTEVRSVLGFSRTGPALEEAINSSISALLTIGQLGEGSDGIRSRA